jgi:hypothetical protein
MKKIIFQTLLLALLVLQGCIKDRSVVPPFEDGLGSGGINTLLIQFEEDADRIIEVFQGNILTVVPIITSAPGYPEFNAGEHRFEWVVTNRSGTPRPQPIDTLNRNLDLQMILRPGDYNLRYRVFNRQTNVFAERQILLRVKTRTSNGWLIMSEVDEEGVIPAGFDHNSNPLPELRGNVKMRLSMISTTGFGSGLTFDEDFIQDVFFVTQSRLPLEARGKPIGMVDFTDNMFNSPNNLAFYILTETGSNRIATQDFDRTITEDGERITIPQMAFSWIPEWNIRNHFMNPRAVPLDFRAFGIWNASSRSAAMIHGNDGNLYTFNPSMTIYFSNPANANIPGGTPFKVHPKMVTGSGASWIVFDETSRSFRRISGTSAVRIPTETINILENFNYENVTNYDFIDILSGIDNYIILRYRNESSEHFGKYRVLQTASDNMSQKRFRTVDDATQLLFEQAFAQERPVFEVGGKHDMNIYFAVGGTVYSYSTAENRTIQVLDKPGSEITYLKFNNATQTGGLAVAGEDIMVGSFDGQYGMIEQFFVGEHMQSAAWGESKRTFGIHTTPSINVGKIVEVRTRGIN